MIHYSPAGEGIVRGGKDGGPKRRGAKEDARFGMRGSGSDPRWEEEQEESPFRREQDDPDGMQDPLQDEYIWPDTGGEDEDEI